MISASTPVEIKNEGTYTLSQPVNEAGTLM